MQCNKFRKLFCEEECKITDSEKYILKLRNARGKLHRNYIIAICVGVIILLSAWIIRGNTEFETLLSFASTVTSIILSVLAIIMSIFGNEKTMVNQSRLEETIKRLEDTSKTIQEVSENTDISLRELKDAVNKISNKVDEMPNRIAETAFRMNKLDSQPEYEEAFNGGWINEE